MLRDVEKTDIENIPFSPLFLSLNRSRKDECSAGTAKMKKYNCTIRNKSVDFLICEGYSKLIELH
jgi:hypothetical protein